MERIGGRGAEAWRIHHEDQRAARRPVILLNVGDPDFATPRPSSGWPWRRCAPATHYTERRAGARCASASPATHALARPHRAARAGGGGGRRQNALFSAAQCLLEDGDGAGAEPMYVTLQGHRARHRRQTLLALVPVRADGSLRIDLDALARHHATYTPTSSPPATPAA